MLRTFQLEIEAQQIFTLKKEMVYSNLTVHNVFILISIQTWRRYFKVFSSCGLAKKRKKFVLRTFCKCSHSGINTFSECSKHPFFQKMKKMIQKKAFHKWCRNNLFCANVRITLLEEHLREPCQNVSQSSDNVPVRRTLISAWDSYSRNQQVEKLSDGIYLSEKQHISAGLCICDLLDQHDLFKTNKDLYNQMCAAVISRALR